MCDQDALVGYLYDELTAEERKTFESHLEACQACRSEVRALQQTRTRLGEWTAPEPGLAFEIVRAARPVPVVRPTWRWQGWGLAAAAVLVLAAAAGLANLDVRYDASGLTVRTGWGHAEPALAAAVIPAPAAETTAADTTLQRTLVALQARLDDLEAAARARESATVPARAPLTAASETALLRRVEGMVRDSESRQQQELAQRLRQMWRDVSVARRSDMDMMQRGLIQVQDTTVIRQRDLENQFYRAVGQRQK